jgi:hypothetical protein
LTATSSTCPGCGLGLPDGGGPTHPYIGATAACWALYGELLSREFGDPAYFEPVHALTVHAYAVQHPGVPERRSIQSVCLHLCALCLIFERDAPIPRSTELMSRIGPVVRESLRWLDPPQPNGTLTVRDALRAGDPGQHADAIRRWGEDVWAAWAPHHPSVRGWVDLALGPPA